MQHIVAPLLLICRDLKMYNQHFAESLSCILIQMRRKSPPSTLQRLQSIVAESNVDDTASFCKAASPQFSTPQISPQHNNVQNQETNTDLFSIEIGKQAAFPTNSQEKGEWFIETCEEPFYLAGTDEWKDLIYSNFNQMTNTSMYLHARENSFCALHVCNSPMCKLGPALHGENSTASSTASRTSSVRSMSTQCNGSGFFSSISANNYSGASLSYMKELVDTSLASRNTDQTLSAWPKNIHENVKVIFVQPRITHASCLMENLLSEEGLTSNKCSFFGQQEQHLAANGFDIVYPGQVNFKERENGEPKMIANVHTLTGLSQPSPLLDTTRRLLDENRERNNCLDPFTCSFCQQVAPKLGKRPVSFSYNHLLLATDCFSRANLLGEDETGAVYKGLLKNGHHIAVKKFREPFVKGDDNLLIELELLSYAQHRNLVMLLGYCAEDTLLMLVYEYVCNRSLSWHLAKANNPNGLEWWARQKIAVGAARGLRYLHEESRGSCIVHGEVGSDNIFLTHHFLPMVGNFGLACLQQVKMDLTDDKTSGYLDKTRQDVSWKTDVYAFGVVLLELLSGRRAIDNFVKPEQESLVDWARPLLRDGKYHELLDPRLESSYDSFEMVCMVRAATLCISEHPFRRPQMSQVLHILERGSGNNDYVELPFSKDLQCDQKNAPDVKPRKDLQCDQKDAPDVKPQLQVVASPSTKPQTNSKRVKISYDKML